MARTSSNAPLLRGLLKHRLRSALRRKGWRPSELARQIERLIGRRVDPSMVRRWVNGQKLPSLEYVAALAAALDVSADWLMRPDRVENQPSGPQEGRSKAGQGAGPQHGALPGESSHAERASPRAGVSRPRSRGSTLPDTPLSAGEIAERAAELVSRAAMRLYQRAGPSALADWLLKLSVETDPEEVRELQDFVDLARQLLQESDAAGARTGGGREGDPPQ